MNVGGAGFDRSPNLRRKNHLCARHRRLRYDLSIRIVVRKLDIRLRHCAFEQPVGLCCPPHAYLQIRRKYSTFYHGAIRFRSAPDGSERTSEMGAKNSVKIPDIEQAKIDQLTQPLPPTRKAALVD